jgi:iron(III) transport system permease protein
MVLIYWFILDINTLDFSTFDYLYNTLSLNIFSSLVIIFLSFFVIYMLRFYPSKVGNITHKLSILGYSIPGAIVGIGSLIGVYFGIKVKDMVKATSYKNYVLLLNVIVLIIMLYKTI